MQTTFNIQNLSPKVEKSADYYREVKSSTRIPEKQLDRSELESKRCMCENIFRKFGPFMGMGKYANSNGDLLLFTWYQKMFNPS